MLQELDLPQRPLGQNFFAEDISDLLDGNALAAGLGVRGGTDDAVGALADLFGHRVALVDDEILVEDFEDLTALQRWVGHVDGFVG